MFTYSYTYYTFDQLFSQNNSKCKDCNLFECSYNFSRELLTREQNHYFYRALFFTHKQTPTTRDLNTKSDKIKKTLSDPFILLPLPVFIISSFFFKFFLFDLLDYQTWYTYKLCIYIYNVHCSLCMNVWRHGNWISQFHFCTQQ